MKSLRQHKNNYTGLVSIFILIFSLPFNAFAEEQRDLREGITGDHSNESEWGFLPRFKMNPDTGIGTGIKLKGSNVFGTHLYFDIANIITTTRYQIYELMITAPKFGPDEEYWYVSAFTEFDLVPDMRFFGIGNDTKNFMENETDDKTGNESTLQYKNIDSRFLLGRCFGKIYFISLEPLYREVWIGKGDSKNLGQTIDIYKSLEGTDGGRSAGLRLSLLMSGRDDQWRPSSGSRLEMDIDNRGNYFGSDYTYTKLSGDIRKYINLYGDYNVLALHLKTETAAGGFNDAPWWDLPYVGGRDSLRGYWEGRFRSRSIILTNVEYRFHLFNASPKVFKHELRYIFDANIFFDAGRAFTPEDDWNDTPKKDWKYSCGFGIRLATPPGLMGRLDIGFSEEMKYAVYFNFGTVF